MPCPAKKKAFLIQYKESPKFANGDKALCGGEIDGLARTQRRPSASPDQDQFNDLANRSSHYW